jgi:hypothetical protein
MSTRRPKDAGDDVGVDGAFFTDQHHGRSADAICRAAERVAQR